MATLGFNLGLTYGAWATGHTSAMYVPLFCSLVCACAWYVVERQIKRERNDAY